MSQPRFKPGDKVKIISQPPKDRTEGPQWVDTMDECCGKICTVVSSSVGSRYIVYSLEPINKMSYSYLESWLEPYESDPDEILRQKRDELLRSVFAN